MFYIIITQLIELQIPLFLAVELETNFLKPTFSFLIHHAVFEECTLLVDPSAQFWVFLVPEWHTACNSGRRQGGTLVGVFKMKAKRSTAPNKLTVTMFGTKFLQLLELRIPCFQTGLVLGIEIETNFGKHPFSFRVHSATCVYRTLIVDPYGQLWVVLALPWHIAYNTGRETVGVLVRVFKTKIKRSTVNINSQ
jgi:hypothetical protein